MLFKYISFPELTQPFVQWSRTICAMLVEGYNEDQFCEIILNWDQWFRRRCLLKIFPLWSFGDHFVQRSENMFPYFGRGYQEEQFCEIILKLDQWFRRRCLLKDFISGALAALLFSGAEQFKQF